MSYKQKRPDVYDSKLQENLEFHLKDPFYVNEHEKTVGSFGFKGGVDWIRKFALDHFIRLAAEVEKMRELQRQYFSSRTDRNLKEAKRQEILVDELLVKFKRSGGFNGHEKNPESTQEKLF